MHQETKRRGGGCIHLEPLIPSPPAATERSIFLRIWWLKALLCLVGRNSPYLNLYYYLPY